MTTETQKLVEKWEKKKKKVKNVSYYKKILLKQSGFVIRNIFKIINIIKEEMDISLYDGESPYGVVIDKQKVLKNKILISDAGKIIDLLKSDKYLAIPKNEEWFSDEELKNLRIGEFFVFFPIKDWCEVTVEPCFKYPYEENFNNLDKAIKEILDAPKEVIDKNYNIYFDKGKGILRIKDRPIKFRKYSNQYYLIEIIFKNKESRNKDWQFSEMGEDEESPLGSFSDKNIYNIANAIKHKIAEEVGIKNLFITTTYSIMINKKYLKKS